MKLHFSGFIYDTQQKILKHGTQTIELTKKNHTLLAYLLSHPKQLISREELIDQIWQGRVVTNNTIDQCILKLRKTLNQVHEAEYIETVYGQGIRFLPEINKADEVISPVIKRIKYEWLVLLTVISSLFIWLLIQNHNKPYNTTIEPLNLDVISQAANTPSNNPDDWMLDGGSAYLSYLLHLYPNINLQKTDRIKASGTQKPHIILDLIGVKQSNMMLQVDLYQQPISENGINSYHADLSLSKNNFKLAETQLTASQLAVLFQQVASWVAQYDGAETPQQVIDPNVFTQNEQALLRYFQGLTEQISGNNELALNHFKAATDLDSDFKMAWYEMAIALRKQGDSKKAISVLNAIVSNDQWLAFRVAVAKGITYNVLEDPNAANESYEMALQSAKATNNLDGMAAIYINQAIMFSDMSLNEQAEQRLLLAIELTDLASQPRRYGSIMNTYAKVAMSMNNLPLAVEKSQSAIEAYQISGHVRYEMHAKSRLAGLLILSNELNQAEGLVKESLSYAEQLKNPDSLSSNHTKLATIYQRTGRFELAIEQWQAAIGINDKLDLYPETADAYLWLLKLHLDENNTAQAEIVINMLKQLYNEHPLTPIASIYIEALLLHALFIKDTNAAQQQIKQLTEIQHELLSMYQGDLAFIQQKYEAAEMHYLEALIKLNPTGRFDVLALIMNKLNQLYLSYNQQKLNENIQRTLKLKPFIYPVQKYQAMAAHADGKDIEALSLMEELKMKAGDFWQLQDQLLLDNMQKPSD